MGKKCFGKSRSEPERIFPHKPKVPLQRKISCFVKSSVNGLTFYYYFLMILHKIVIETPTIDINDVESRFSAIDDNFVEPWQYFDDDESDLFCK